MLQEEIRDYWDKRYQGYSHKNLKELRSGQDLKWQAELRRWLKKDRSIRILDIGTGPGFFPILLKRMGYIHVTAIDTSEKMLAIAKENLALFGGDKEDNICFQQMDAQKLPFLKESFDLILVRNVTWNLENPKEAYENWLKVLKKGGKLLVYDANWYAYLEDLAVRETFESNLKQAHEENLEDYWHGEGVDEAKIEAIARKLPLTDCKRPEWDLELLSQYPEVSVEVDVAFGQKIWSHEELLNYAATPLFALYLSKKKS